MSRSLHPFQERAVRFVQATPRCALFVSMGLGKSVVLLTAIRNLISRGQVRRALVIAPKRVAERTWVEEARVWTHTADLSFVHILGSSAQRRAALATAGHVFVINRDNVRWLVEQCARCWPFDMVVIDESSSFKDPGAERFKALRKVCRSAARMVLLSGTPAPNSYLELWPQFYLLDQGKRLGTTFGGYRAAYFSPARRDRQQVYAWRLDEGARERIEARIADISLSLPAHDDARLPPCTTTVVPVVLAREALRAYVSFERNAVLACGGQALVSAANAAVLSNKLAQASNGAVYDDAGAVHTLHDAKLDALAMLVQSVPGSVLVAYGFRHDRQRIKARFAQAVDLGEPGAIERWNAGQIRMLLAHPASAGHGLNLQAGGATLVWFGLTWSNELHLQFNARLHRQGQSRPVEVFYLAARHTIDEDILEALAAKEKAQAVLLEGLRRRLAAQLPPVTKAQALHPSGEVSCAL